MDSPATNESPLLALEGVHKRFHQTVANDNIDLQLGSGEIHALLGENGAGKSTLVRILYGILKPDSGVIRWRGKPIKITSPAMARELGIAMVFQHFSLFESLTTLENIALGMDKTMPLKTLRQRVISMSEQYGLPLDPDALVHTLSVGERQRIEIIRCFLQNPKLLVMDEPTSVLTPQETHTLFKTLRQLADEGVTVLYISHKLDEIKALCGAATILREGRVVDRVTVSNETTHSLATKMMGAELATSAQPMAAQRGAIRLQLSGLSLPPQNQFSTGLHDIHVSVRGGEIVGIAGIAGNGQDALLQAINGEIPTTPAQNIAINNQPCGHLSVNQRRRLGLASIPADRLGHAVVAEMNLIDNALLTAFERRKLAVNGLIQHAKCSAFCAQIVHRFKVRGRTINDTAGSLSGGNLQKFIVGREMSQEPSVLVVAQPTWGVDANSAREIHQSLRTLAANGSAILVISQDLDELMSVCNRIATIFAGRLSDTVDTERATVKQIGLWMSGIGLQQDE